MTVIVKHNKTNTITDWTQAQLNEQIALGNFAPGTLLADIVLPSDWNNDHTLTGLGTMAEQNATAVAITGGTINNTTIGATTASTGAFTSVTTPSVTATTTDLTLSAISTGAVNLNTAGGTQFKALNRASADVFVQTQGGQGGVSRVSLGATFSGASASGFNIYNTGGQPIRFQTTGNGVDEQFNITPTTSAVNYVQVTGGATGNIPTISAQGSDGNVALAFTSKATGAIRFYSNSSSYTQLRIDGTVSAVNYHDLYGGVAGNAISYKSAGSDTNISMAFQPKGTGAIDLAAGSSGVNISNGGTVTAITRTNTGVGYTSIPSVAVSAPTTAGGVTSTASANMFQLTVGIAGGGTGYTAGNVLTVVGGTGSASQITVSTVSAGVITAVTPGPNSGLYSVLPTNPVSVTGGSGTGATFNILTYGVSTLTIGNAGSGYIEQPTITFSGGGGGSGAAATARVGTGTTFRSLGGTTSFNTYSGEGLRINNDGFGTLTDYIEIQGGASVAGAYIGVNGSTGTASLYASAKGGGTVDFFTNGQGNARQARVSHTASAVNYVQVTGGITSTGIPRISAQGSDGTASIALTAKSATIWLESVSGFAQAAVTHTASANNYLTFTGGNNTSPNIGVASSSNADIDITLTPKGTGLVRFGTYVAGATLATGYINIKAADGTTYKVLVST